MPESYFPLDVNFADHPKIVGLSDAAFRVWAASIAYSNRLMTDGFIAQAIVHRFHDCDWGDDQDTPKAHAAELVAAGLWHPVEGGYQIHDFTDHNRSKQERLDVRDKERERKAAYRRRQRPDGTDDGGDGGVPPDASVTGTVNTETETETETEKVNTIVEQPAPNGASARPVGVHPETVRLVFDTWRKAANKPKARCDPKRTTRIVNALKAYPLEDVLDAVQGWRNSPHHCGQNDRGTVYNELELLLRDAAHIEAFRDLARDGPRLPLGKRTQQLANHQQGMRAVGIAKGVIGNGNGMGPVDQLGRPDQRELAGPAGRTADSG